MLNKPLIITIVIVVAVLGLIALTTKPTIITVPNIVSPKANVPNFEKTKANTNANNESASLSGLGLQKVPSEIWSQAGLVNLDLSNNQLTGALPSQIGQLKNLKTLDVSNNLMTGVPAEIGRLTDLESINFANNKLTGLPNELGNLTNLKIINLTGNDYSQQDLAEIKKKLPNLRVIE